MILPQARHTAYTRHASVPPAPVGGRLNATIRVRIAGLGVDHTLTSSR